MLVCCAQLNLCIFKRLASHYMVNIFIDYMTIFIDIVDKYHISYHLYVYTITVLHLLLINISEKDNFL